MQTPSRDRVEVLDDVVVRVVDGEIVDVSAAGPQTTADVELDNNVVLIPGLIDLHIHAPQWPQLGVGYDLPLEDWLFSYTFPTEARFHDLNFAQSVWDSLVPSLLAHGTTTAVYYGSIHVPATTALAQTCIRHGQRAFVGRVAMDHPDGTPESYRDQSTDQAISDTRESIRQIQKLDDPDELVQPIITPRFVPACTDELLRGLGDLAAETDLLVQTHCSENDWEHQHVRERFGVSDTRALDDFGLLRESTVLAHCGFLGDDDLTTIAARGSGIAHCPLSNIYFGNAVFAARRALDAGVRVGLGTDIAGGPSPSLLAQAANAVNSARMLQEGVDATLSADRRGSPNSTIDATTGFWLATRGGAEVLGLPLGLIEPGRSFDAVAVSLHDIDHLPGGDQPEQRFEKLVRLATRRDIKAVWVQGRLVSDSP